MCQRRQPGLQAVVNDSNHYCQTRHYNKQSPLPSGEETDIWFVMLFTERTLIYPAENWPMKENFTTQKHTHTHAAEHQDTVSSLTGSKTLQLNCFHSSCSIKALGVSSLLPASERFCGELSTFPGIKRSAKNWDLLKHCSATSLWNVNLHTAVALCYISMIVRTEMHANVLRQGQRMNGDSGKMSSKCLR